MKLNTHTDSPTPSPTCWYAIHTKPRAEKKVFDRLSLKGFIVYLPLVTSIREWSDRKKETVTPLISTFVFININKDELYDTLKIQGTTGILKYLGKPAIIRDHEIENLKILMNETGKISKLEDNTFEKGEEVEVIKGSFKGLTGQSVNIQGRHRIIIEIKALGSRMAVNVPLSFVRKRVVFDNKKIILQI